MPEMTVERVPAAAVARLLLHANALLDDFERPRTWAGVASVIDHMGYIPFGPDGFAVEHILWGRSSNYTRDSSALWTKQAIFLGRADGRALIPMAHYPHFRPGFWRARGDTKWAEKLGEHGGELLDYVRHRIRTRGPLTSHAVSSPAHLPPDAAGRWPKPKVGLDYLVATGEVVSVGIRFDLAERVIPQQFRDAPITPYEEWACRSAIERLVLASAKEIAAFWGVATQREAEEWCRDAVERGELRPAVLEPAQGERRPASYVLADWRERLAATAEPRPGPRLLSPHDPSIRNARRRHQVFGLAPIPEVKADEPRRTADLAAYPVLRADRFIARVLARHDRRHRTFTVERVVWEDEAARASASMDEIEACVNRLAGFAEADVAWADAVHEA